MKQKLLVCGATGFVGRNMVEYFAQKGEYDIHAVRFNRQAYECKGVTWHQADLRDPEKLEKLLDNVDIIIQAAATTSGAKDIVARPYIHVTDNAVMNSLLFRVAFERKVKHVIFFSCTVMYQSANEGVKESDFNANTPLHPRYFGAANTKLYIEKMCEFYASISETKFTAIRHSNIYGAHDKFDLKSSHVFGATITKVMSAKEAVTVWGTGDEERDLLHVDDLTNFVDLSIKKQRKKFGLYNCGLGKALSIKNLVNKVVKASGKSLEIKYDLSQPSIKTSLSLDCTLAEQELGWKPQITLDEGIQRTIKWWCENIEPSSIDIENNNFVIKKNPL